MSELIDLGPIEGIEGHWVVVLKGKVVAGSEKLDEMLRFAHNYPSDDVVVTMIPHHDASFY